MYHHTELVIEPKYFEITFYGMKEDDKMQIRKYQETDLPEMTSIWNEVVEEGIAFPQEEYLTEENGGYFFASQSYTGVAENDGKIVGLYILHPNNVGRCGHICMPVMQYHPHAGASISVKNWCWTA